MKRFWLLFIISPLLLFCQSKKFANQGEAEDFQSKKFFQEEYAREEYPKFDGIISQLDEQTYIFDNKTLVIWGTSKALLDIFTNRLFYPQLLVGHEVNVATKSKTELNELSSEERITYITSKNDSVKISDLEELTFLSKSPKTRRFRFWFYRQGFMNPQVYFIELRNVRADRRTSLKEFIAGSKLTFLKGGWIII